jgi:hypothetical protein
LSSGPDPAPVTRRRGRFWLNVGEVVGVLAVIIAALSYWDSHHDRSLAAKHADAQAKAQATLVVTGETDGGGRRIVLRALKAEQAIQSQRYVFPTAVLDHAMEVTAAAPQIDVNWIATGLRRDLDTRRAAGAGEARLPVGIETTYVEDGETRTDRSLYRVGYAWRGRLLLGRQIILQGISLSQRGVGGDLQALVNQRWAAAPSTAPGGG